MSSDSLAAPGRPITRFYPEKLFGEDFDFDTKNYDNGLIYDFISLPSSPDQIVVAVHGACDENGRKGAKSAFGVYFARNSLINFAEPVRGTMHTSQRAELRATIEGLARVRDTKTWIQAPHPPNLSVLPQAKHGLRRVIIKSCSAYLVYGMTDYMKIWAQNGYIDTNGEAVRNADLFMRIGQEVWILRQLGMDVLFWLVPKSRNEEANKLAKSVLK